MLAETRWATALLVYRNPRIIAVLFLGFSSGLPLQLTGQLLSSWLTQEGLSLTSIGLFSLIGIPYSLKFLWAPLIDNIELPFLTRIFGRRRAWLLLLQLLMILAIVSLSASQPKTDVQMVAIIAISVAFISASYDIVVDALRIEICDEHNMGAGAAMFVYGYRCAMFLSGFGGLVIADLYGWTASYLAMAGFVLIGTVTTLLLNEPNSARRSGDRDNNGGADKRHHSWFRHAIIDPFTDFIRRRDWIVILLFVVFYKLGDSMAGVMSYPFYLKIGFTLTEIAEIAKLFGTIATFAGLFLGGWLLAGTDLIRALWICGILQMLSNLMFAAQAMVGADLMFLTATIGLENLAGGMGTAVFVAYLSSLCSKEFTATQYALLTSLTAIARTFLAAPSGWVADQTGWVEFFLFTTIAALPGLVLLWWLTKGQRAGKAGTEEAG